MPVVMAAALCVKSCAIAAPAMPVPADVLSLAFEVQPTNDVALHNHARPNRKRFAMA